MDLPEMTRRRFIGGALMTGACFALTGCGNLSRGTSTQVSESNYYVANKDKILKELEPMSNAIWQVTSEKYDSRLANQLFDDAQASFEAELQNLPYIGGNENELTANLYQSAFALCFYREMSRQGKSLEETGELLYRGVERMMSGSVLNGAMGVLATSDLMSSKVKEEAKISQQKKYPEDWVFEFVSGKGQQFDFGVDYTECGICKYFKAKQAPELIPYLCLLDFPISRAMNTGLIRTQTLGNGGTLCDFRYKQGGKIQMEWTPAFLTEEGDPA